MSTIKFDKPFVGIDALNRDYVVSPETTIKFTNRPGGHRTMKIHLVTLHSVDSGKPERQYLVKSHTKAGAEKHVRGKIAPFIEAKVPTQDELVAALKSGIEIEDAYASPQASIPEPNQQEPQS